MNILTDPTATPITSKKLIPPYEFDLVIFGCDDVLVPKGKSLYPEENVEYRLLPSVKKKVQRLHCCGVKTAVCFEAPKHKGKDIDLNIGKSIHWLHVLMRLTSITTGVMPIIKGTDLWDQVVAKKYPHGLEEQAELASLGTEEYDFFLPKGGGILWIMTFLQGQMWDNFGDETLDPRRVLFVGSSDLEREAAKGAGVDFQWASNYFGEEKWTRKQKKAQKNYAEKLLKLARQYRKEGNIVAAKDAACRASSAVMVLPLELFTATADSVDEVIELAEYHMALDLVNKL